MLSLTRNLPVVGVHRAMDHDCCLTIVMNLPKALYEFTISFMSVAQIIDNNVVIISPTLLAEFLLGLLRISHEDIPFDLCSFADSLRENLLLSLVVVIASPGNQKSPNRFDLCFLLILRRNPNSSHGKKDAKNEQRSEKDEGSQG